MNIKQRIQRFEAVGRLREEGLTFKEIGEMYDVSRARIHQIAISGIPKPRRTTNGNEKLLQSFGFIDLSGRDRTRMLVRIRDNFTCQDCGAIRTPSEVQNYNDQKKTLKGKKKLFDVHHTKGMCGKNSTGYDRSKDLSGMITLCHKCHFNRPEHKSNSRV